MLKLTDLIDYMHDIEQEMILLETKSHIHNTK